MLKQKFRRSSATAIKAVLSLLFGVFVRIFFGNLSSVSLFTKSRGMCTQCSDICGPCLPNSVSMPLDETLTKKYIPKGMYEITRWYYFDDNYLYDIINEQPKVPLIGQWKEETQAVTQIALEYINVNKMMGRTWTLLKRENGYMQSDVQYGTEYILDLKVKSMQDDVIETFRTTLLHPLQHEYKVEKVIQDTQNPVHIIVPLSGNYTNTLALLNHFKETAVKIKDLCLSLIMFSGNGKWGRPFDENIQTFINKWLSENSDLCVKQHITLGGYNYAHALKNVANLMSDNDIILTLKDDVEYYPEVIESCRSISISKKRVYIPLAFAQHDPINIENGMPVGKPKNIDKKDINKFTGHWLYNVHDFICAYASDFNLVLQKTFSAKVTNNSPDEIYFEDSEYGTDMYNKFLSHGFQVISSVEPGLLRLFKNHNCQTINDEKSKRECVIQQLESAGSKQALNILYLTEKASKYV